MEVKTSLFCITLFFLPPYQLYSSSLSCINIIDLPSFAIHSKQPSSFHFFHPQNLAYLGAGRNRQTFKRKSQKRRAIKHIQVAQVTARWALRGPRAGVLIGYRRACFFLISFVSLGGVLLLSSSPLFRLSFWSNSTQFFPFFLISDLPYKIPFASSRFL